MAPTAAFFASLSSLQPLSSDGAETNFRFGSYFTGEAGATNGSQQLSGDKDADESRHPSPLNASIIALLSCSICAGSLLSSYRKL
jgi:hypothetical protein